MKGSNSLLFNGSYIDALIIHWTKLWIDVILHTQKKNKPRNLNNIFLFEVYQIPHMGKYFHVDHARRTCTLQRIQTWQRNGKGMQNHVISKKQHKVTQTKKNEGLLC